MMKEKFPMRARKEDKSENEMSNISIQNKFEIEVERMINGVFYVDDRCGSNAKKQLCRQRLFFDERYQESHATIFS